MEKDFKAKSSLNLNIKSKLEALMQESKRITTLLKTEEEVANKYRFLRSTETIFKKL
jgi:hypothetical protein